MTYTSVINTDQIQSVIEENIRLKQEIQAARRETELTAELVAKQLDETENILRRFQRANAQRNAVLNSASHISIIATNESGIITIFNTGAENLLGYQAEEVVGKQGPEIFHLKSELIERSQALSAELGCRIEYMDIFRHYALQEVFNHLEWTYVRKDGVQFPVDMSINPLQSSNGIFAGSLSIAIDISEKKSSEEALMKSEKNYRLLINNIPNIVFRGYMDGSIDILDDKVESLTGYPKEDFLSGKITWLDMIIENDVESIKSLFKQALKTKKKNYIREYRIQSKQGEIIWVEEVGQIVCDSKGQIEFITGSVLDISKRKVAEDALRKAHDQLEERVKERTAALEKANRELHAEINERKQAEEALRESEKKYRSIFEKATGGIYQSTPDGRILTANPAFVKIMGYDNLDDLKANVSNLKKTVLRGSRVQGRTSEAF